MPVLWTLYGDFSAGMTGISGNYQLLSLCLAAYLLARVNVLRRRRDLKPIAIPQLLHQILDGCNIVAETRAGMEEISMTISFGKLQLHNVFAEDDPFVSESVKWLGGAVSNILVVERVLFALCRFLCNLLGELPRAAVP